MWILLALLGLVFFFFLFPSDSCHIYRPPGYHRNRIPVRPSISRIPERTLTHSEIGLSQQNMETIVFTGNILKPFVFPLNPKVCSAESVYLLVVVQSKPSNFLQRQTIRETWGSEFNNNNNFKMKLIFLTGQSDKLTNNQLHKEGMLYNDSVQATFEDSYRNLTLKSTAMLQWVRQFCPQAKYITKTDDDVFIHTSNLLSLLDLLNDEKRIILGHIHIGNTPVRNSSDKWYVTREEYPFEIYPPYAYGLCYVMSSDLIDDLYYTAQHKSRLYIEDVLVTGLYAHLARASLVGWCGFREVPSTSFFLTKSAVAVHGYSPEEMKALWKSLKPWVTFFF